MSGAIWAYGSLLQMSETLAGTYVSIAEITELTPPSMSADDIDVTSHSSPDGWREKIKGLKDGGEVSFKANWLPTDTTHDGTTGLYEAFKSKYNKFWKIVLPDSIATISFAGGLTAFEPDLPLEEQATLSGTIVVSGAVTIA
jgi:predicted secreted protein